jgi:hypothetical protein
MDSIDIELTKGAWVIVFGTVGKYIGRVRVNLNALGFATDDDSSPEAIKSIKQDVLDSLGKRHLSLSFAQELNISLIPQQMQTPQGIQMGFARNIEALPVSRCLEIESTVVHLVPQEVVFLDEMSPSDRTWHKELVARGYKSATNARLASSGLVPPGPVGKFPRGVPGGNA